MLLKGKGSRFIFLHHTNTFSATIECFLTLWARQSNIVLLVNKNNSLEKRNVEKKNKSWNKSNLLLRPGVLEKGNIKDFV
jgi:hypothetical protein